MNWGISESEINKSASLAAVSDSLFLGKDKIKIVTFLGMQDLKSFKSQLIGYLFGGTKMIMLDFLPCPRVKLVKKLAAHER